MGRKNLCFKINWILRERTDPGAVCRQAVLHVRFPSNQNVPGIPGALQSGKRHKYTGKTDFTDGETATPTQHTGGRTGREIQSPRLGGHGLGLRRRLCRYFLLDPLRRLLANWEL